MDHVIRTAAKAPSVAELLGVRYTSDMQAAFPETELPYAPLGYYLLLQVRLAKVKSRGGIIMPDEVRDTERVRGQIGLVRAMGPSSFKRRDTLEPWPEGAWCGVGDFVRAPMYGGDRYVVTAGKEEVLFLFVRDTDLIAAVTGDPLTLGIS